MSSKAAKELGAAGGRAKSEAKGKAARANGKLGGRPRKATWIEGQPPCNGWPYVAIGRLIGTGEREGSVSPFCGVVQFVQDGDWVGWCWEGCLAFSQDPDDTVVIDWYIELPPGMAQKEA